MGQKAEGPQAIVQRDDGDASPRQARAIVGVLRSGAAQIPAAMDPNHDRLPRLAIERRGPDVQGEAILALPRLAQGKAGTGRLDGDRTEVLGRPDTVPNLRR